MDWNLACNAKKEAENEDMRKKSAKHYNFLLLKERLYNLCEKKVFLVGPWLFRLYTT